VLAVRPNSIALVAARSGRVSAELGADGTPRDIAFGPRSAWIVLSDRQRIVSVDPATRRITGHIGLPFPPGGIAAAGRAAWVSEDSGPRVVRIVRRPNGALAVDRQLSIEARGQRASSPSAVAVGAGSLWLTRGAEVVRADERTGRVLHRFPTPVMAGLLVFHDGNVWAASSDSGLVVKIDPATNRIVAHTQLRSWISDLAVGDGFVWVPVVPAGVVYKLSVDDLSLKGQLPTGPDPESVSVGGGSVWIANTSAGSVTRLDPNGNGRRVIGLTSSPLAARYHDGSVWTMAAAAARPLPPLAAGEAEIRIPASHEIGLEPALGTYADRWQRDYATCATLLNYPDSAGAAGRDLRPEIAATLPAVSADGRTYTFRIRAGFRFSPPNGQPVTAETFRYTLERAFSARFGRSSPAMRLLSDIAGAAAYNARKTRHIAGIVVHGNALSIRLLAPDGGFVNHLSEAFFCPVPIGTPAVRGGVQRPIASAGPYFIASSTAGRTVLLRNPNYHGTRPRRAARIVYTTGVPTAKAIALVDAGAAEYIDGYTSDSDPAALATDSSVARRFGPASAAARAGRQRYFVIPVPAVDMIAFNTARPLFRTLRMRRAVSLALDRTALARVFDEQPVDRYIPPAVADLGPSSVTSLVSDATRARRLVGAGRHRAVLYMCGDPIGLGVLPLVRSQLARIGIAVSFDVSSSCLNGPQPRKLAQADMALISPFDNWGDPAATLEAALGSSYGPVALSEDVLRRKILRARATRGHARLEAYAQLDDLLLRRAVPFVAFGGYTTAEYFSPRVGCKVFQSTYHFVDLGALCIRGA
jgi:ABC-type transport system substrate-binding protein